MLMVTRRANILFACIYNVFSGMCPCKYNIRLCLEYILEDVLLVNRAKTTAGPPSFAPLCSFLSQWTYTLSISAMALSDSCYESPLCMPHDLATANRHDHTWTENWAKNICTLCKPLSLVWPGYAHRKGGRRSHFCGTEGKWINCPTYSALLDVCFMIVLRRAGR